MAKYNHKKIEENWRDKWFEDNMYEAVDFDERPKKYILAELPYPSGKYLHVGHMMRYTVPEIYSRFLRMTGHNVLFPMGWDSFGLPAETFAIKEGITPQEAIAKATKDYKKAMQLMGYGIDWNREINTSDPNYYKWTQWMFKRLWEKGLAEVKEMPVWWCEELGVLADEEILTDKDGNKISERGKHPVERKMFKQWVLKITDYADRLLEDLDTVDYYDSVKQGQINWIGKKEGANVTFRIGEEKIEVFTTRPDTLFGVTFLAISPEHPQMEKFAYLAENEDEVREYIEKAKNLSDMEKLTKEKTGVQLVGVAAEHPFDEVEKHIPVFVADYILMDYGTGAVMGVPGHDERDYDFAKKYDLEIIEVISPPKDAEYEKVYTGNGTVTNSFEYDGKNSEEFKKIVVERLKKENKGDNAVTYKLRDQVFSRQRYWGEPIPLIHKEDGSVEAVADEDLPLELPVMEDFLAGEDGISPLEKNEDWNTTKDSDGNPAKRETDTMPTWAGSNWYFIRYIDPKSNEKFADLEKLKYWMPVDKYFGDAGHTTAHLMYARFWYKVLFDQGLVPATEPFQWRMSGGMLLGPDHKKMSKSRGNTINPKDVLENYGADAARTYLAFLGPYEDTYPWNENGIQACYRLMVNIYNLREKVKDVDENPQTIQKYHNMVKKMTSMMNNFKMNTGVSELMIFVNHLKTIELISKETWDGFLRVIAPFAPFIAEELWQELHNHKKWEKENSVHLQDWPEFDKDLAKTSTIELPVQVNGKMKVTLSVAADISEEEVTKVALENEKISTIVGDKKPKKVIYVKNKILNIVI